MWALAVLYGFICLSDTSLHIGNQVATDSFSEANALRAVDAFMKEGVLASYGLPRTGYGLLYPDHGHAGFPDRYVYTHYPPGPEFLLLLYRRVVGEQNIALFRIVNCYIFIAGVILLGQALIARLGMARVCLLTLAMGAVPATWAMAFGLHYQGMAFSLLLFELGVLALVYSAQIQLRLALVSLGLLSFLQGWMSFDYFFISCFVALPACFVFTPATAPLNLPRALALTLAACGGFVLAHALHFGQNVLYFGGLSPAISDMFLAAQGRSYSDVGMRYCAAVTKALRDYITIHPARAEYLGSMASVVAVGLAGILVAPTRAVTVFARRWCVPWRMKVGVLLAASVSLAWVIVMPAHALIHAHFIPRHLTVLCFFVVCVVLLIPQGDEISPVRAQYNRQIVSRMRLMYIAPILVLIIESRSLMPRNWASYHHAGFSIRSAEQPWSRCRIDRSTEGRTISIAGTEYRHGIGTHPHSVIRLSPPRGATTFSGGCGVQDSWHGGSIRCHVWQQGAKLWSSGVLRHGQVASKFIVTIVPEEDVILEIDDGGDHYNADISNWVDLHF
jgi:hypothetical protein